MSIIKLIAIVSLAVAVLTMVTSNQLSIYASPTTEDDGWVEGDDDSQGEISSQEELEEAYEGTQWEDDIGSNEFEDAADNGNEDDTENQDEETQICPDGSEIQADEECPSSAEESPPICDGSFQDCITSNGDFCEAGSDAHECEIDEAESSSVTCPDGTVATSPDACELPPPPEEVFDCGDGTYAATPEECELPPPPEEVFDCGDGTYAATPEECELPPPPEVDCGDGTFAATPEECELPVDCGDGTFAATPEECELPPPNFNCPDVPFYMTCKDTEMNNNDNDKPKVIEKTTVIQGASATATANANANAADVSNCRLDGSANRIQLKFEGTKYLACGLYAGGQKAYSDGFVVGCTQIGNTQLICQAMADSSILNTKTQPSPTQTQPTQTQTQTPTQTPTQSQAIQPAAVGG
jgi:hypothetical protein